ncbi:MAG: hypothetical protein SH868_16485 [Bythopirellula sp.]|nr:hypothetical protein [Bythopirellula sp.]
MNQSLRNLFLALVLGGLFAQFSQGATIIWSNPLGGSFENPGNWIPFGPPGFGDEVFFNIPSPYMVNFSTNANSGNLTIFAGDVTFLLSGGFDYLIQGDVTVGGVGLPPGNTANFTLMFGNLAATGTVNVIENGVLSPDDVTIAAAEVAIQQGGQLRGTATVQGSVINSGLVAPGHVFSGSPGTYNIFGNFSQDSTGILEIEVGGTIQGTQHDVLQVAGMAMLHGRLEMPLINGFTPTIGQGISYVQANTVVGRYDSVSISGVSASVAANLVFLPNAARVDFVAPVTVGFNSGNLLPPPGPNNWGDPNFWGGQVPDSTSVVNVRNLENGERVIELNPSVTGSENAFVHQITLSGQNHEMALRLPEGTNFTAVDQLTVSNLGELQLAGGTAHSKLVKVNPGGQIVGNGVIAGDVRLGTTTGMLQAILSPGFSSGEITIEENLTVAQNGTVEIEIFADNDFDTVIVGEDANLGGTLMVDLSAATPASLIGDEFVVLTAGDVNQTFADIDVMGAPDYFIQPDYSEQSLALLLFGDGDMNCDGDYSSDDVEKFAMAITNPIGYFGQFEIFGEDSGDMNDDGFFDFDDIDDFSQIDFGGGLTADEVLAYLLEYTGTTVPEPSAALLFVVGSALLTGTIGRGQRNRSSISG